MPPGKPFFGLGSRKQREAVPAGHQPQEQQHSVDQAQHKGAAGKEAGADDTSGSTDQVASLHEAKKPSVFKQLFQKCECNVLPCGHTLDSLQALSWPCNATAAGQTNARTYWYLLHVLQWQLAAKQASGHAPHATPGRLAGPRTGCYHTACTTTTADDSEQPAQRFFVLVTGNTSMCALPSTPL